MFWVERVLCENNEREGMTNVCGKQSTYKKDVREGKGGDNKRLWWREYMMDRKGGSIG